MAKFHFVYYLSTSDTYLPTHEITGVRIKFNSQEDLILLLKKHLFPQDLCKKCLNALEKFFEYPYDELTELLKKIWESLD